MGSTLDARAVLRTPADDHLLRRRRLSSRRTGVPRLRRCPIQPDGRTRHRRLVRGVPCAARRVGERESGGASRRPRRCSRPRTSDPARSRHPGRGPRRTVDDRRARAHPVADGEHRGQRDCGHRDRDGVADEPRRDLGASARGSCGRFCARSARRGPGRRRRSDRRADGLRRRRSRHGRAERHRAPRRRGGTPSAGTLLAPRSSGNDGGWAPNRARREHRVDRAHPDGPRRGERGMRSGSNRVYCSSIARPRQPSTSRRSSTPRCFAPSRGGALSSGRSMSVPTSRWCSSTGTSKRTPHSVSAESG